MKWAIAYDIINVLFILGFWFLFFNMIACKLKEKYNFLLKKDWAIALTTAALLRNVEKILNDERGIVFETNLQKSVFYTQLPYDYEMSNNTILKSCLFFGFNSERC